jgi:hypothetical protein
VTAVALLLLLKCSVATSPSGGECPATNLTGSSDGVVRRVAAHDSSSAATRPAEGCSCSAAAARRRRPSAAAP